MNFRSGGRLVTAAADSGNILKLSLNPNNTTD